MMYGVQVLDGCIHDECGRELPIYLQNLPMMGVDSVGQIIRCLEGNAVSSPTFGSLVPYFGSIIHTVSPFQSDSEWEIKLLNCYLNSFRLAWIRKDSNSAIEVARASVATVLLGAGCRGIKVENAAASAARACHLFSQQLSKEENHKSNSPILFSAEDDGVTPECLLHFVLREEDHAHLLLQNIRHYPE